MTPDQQQRVTEAMNLVERYDEIQNLVFEHARISFTAFDLQAQQCVPLWVTVNQFCKNFEGANGLFIPCIQYDKDGDPVEIDLQVWDYGTDAFSDTPEWFTKDQQPEQQELIKNIILNIINIGKHV